MSAGADITANATSHNTTTVDAFSLRANFHSLKNTNANGATKAEKPMIPSSARSQTVVE